jgi:hypothetical protein
MTNQESKVKQNYLAIAVAAIACFVFEAIWYTIFMHPWLDGIGRTSEWLMSAAGYNPVLQYSTALISAALIAFGISCLTQHTGEQTASRGIMVAAMLWFILVLPIFCTEYVFEVRPWSLLGINAGFWLLGMILMGAIVGAWKKK